MRFCKPLIFFLLVVEMSCNSPEAEFDLSQESKTGLGTEGLAEFFYWEFEEEEGIWEDETHGLTGVQQFRDTLKMILGEAHFDEVILKESTQNFSKDSLIGLTNGDKINAMLTHTGQVGKIRPINSLEAQILNYQLEKYPLIAHPTEFHAFIAFHPVQNSYRVYFGSSDQPWPPKPEPLIKQLEVDIQAGWQLKYHLHNHYEPASNDYLGILAPSMADAQYFKMLREKYSIEKALITNGFHTVEIESKDFQAFESH